MPAPLKGALVRETARRGSNVNDVAAFQTGHQLVATDFLYRATEVCLRSGPDVRRSIKRDMAQHPQQVGNRLRSKPVPNAVPLTAGCH